MHSMFFLVDIEYYCYPQIIKINLKFLIYGSVSFILNNIIQNNY